MTSSIDIAQSVYHLDIFSTIGRFIDWKDLIRFYAFDDTARDLVLPEIRRRLFEVVSIFIPENDVPEFFDTLRDSDGLICGSVVRYILLPYVLQEGNELQRKTSPMPNDLNMLVASDRSELFFTFFEKLGYKYSIETPDSLYKQYVTRLEVFRREDSDGKVRTLGDSYTLCIHH
jgi:hypothetical protein